MTRRSLLHRLSVFFCMLFVSACGQDTSQPAATADPSSAQPAAAAASPSIYEMAVASESRPEADRARDAGRKPAEVLEFFGIAPGMTVLDMFTGGGYYAELIGTVVGDEGKVVAIKQGLSRICRRRV